MPYNLTWKVEAEEEFAQLNKSIKNHAFTQFKKLIKSPQLGLPLGNKAGLDLTGYKKLYFFKKKYRIVYELDETNKEVTIFAIGEREGMKVYYQLAKRLESHPK
ncbi:type II toxin-antitoxin system RelE/ParE family toxin [bacterium]|nr:type II toxin-antitoxin system RelE/ParE family toxin [bacterium]